MYTYKEICLLSRELSLVWRVYCGRRVLKVFLKSYCVWVCVCVYMHVSASVHSHCDQTTMGASWRSNSDHQAWQQVPLPAKPSCHPAAVCLIWHCWWKESSQQQFSNITEKWYYFSEKNVKQLIQLRIHVELLLLRYIRLWLFRLQDAFEVGFVPLPQEGLPGLRSEECWRVPKGIIPTWDCISRSSRQTLANLNKTLVGHMEQKPDFPPRSMGMLLCSAGDLFPLMIPRWRWGMRILQGNSSPPLGNRPTPDFSETPSWNQQGRQRLKDRYPTSK